MDSQLPVLLIGGAGVPNYGDELILASWVEWYTERGFRSLTADGSRVPVLRAVLRRYPHVALSAAGRAGRFLHPGPYPRDFYDCLRDGYNFLIDRSNDDSALSRQFLDAGIIHLYGGGYLNRQLSTHAFLLGLAWAATERTGCRAVGTGLGWGPLAAESEHDRTALDAALRAFAFMEVRDGWSRRFLNDVSPAAHIIGGLDDAFVRPVAATPQPGSALHISLQANDSAREIVDRLPKGFVNSFDAHYFWLCTSDDAAAYISLAKKFSSFVPLSWWSLIDETPVHDTNVMISARFHPHLLGVRSGMSGAFVSNSPYYDVKHGSLIALGSPFTKVASQDMGDFAESSLSPVAPVTDTLDRDQVYMAQKAAVASRIVT